MGTISDKLDYLNDTKDAIKTAIVNKGVTVGANDTFRSYATKIGSISTKVAFPSGIRFGTSASTFTDASFLENVDFSNITSIGSMFNGCNSLVTIPTFDTSNITSLVSTFQKCTALTTIGELNFGSVVNINSAFVNSSALTTLGGFKDLGKAYNTSQSANQTTYTLNLSASSSITHDSLMNVINDLYDIAGKGVQTQQLVLGNTNLARLSSAEISVATNKGWTVS